MPRIKRQPDKRIQHPELLDALVEELNRSGEIGQPLIDEFLYPESGKIRVHVIWDRWELVRDEERYRIIMAAYEKVEGKEYRDRIVLAAGFTVPESVELGLLPFEVTAAVRDTDPVTVEQCRAAMIEEGASRLLGDDRPQLRYMRLEDAEAGLRSLKARLPGSESVWMVVKQMMSSSESW